MSEHAPRTLFLAVPGTQETRQLDLETVRQAVARGEIALDNWAWSAERNEWVPLAHLPEFAAPAEPLPTAPEPIQIVRVEPIPEPVVAKAAEPARVPIPAQVPPARTVTGPVGRMTHAPTHFTDSIKEHHEFPVFRTLFVVLGVVIAALVAVNYFMVEQPFRANLAKTPFASVQAHAHLGAFVQPGVLLIHILPNKEINADNFADLLTALTQSAPRQAIAGREFTTISLTPAWLGVYAIDAADWQSFADMGGFTPEEKRQFVLDHLERIDGAPLLETFKTDTAAQRQTREDQVWNELVAQFHGA
jgi:hypothetical protein